MSALSLKFIFRFDCRACLISNFAFCCLPPCASFVSEAGVGLGALQAATRDLVTRVLHAAVGGVAIAFPAPAATASNAAVSTSSASTSTLAPAVSAPASSSSSAAASVSAGDPSIDAAYDEFSSAVQRHRMPPAAAMMHFCAALLGQAVPAVPTGDDAHSDTADAAVAFTAFLQSVARLRAQRNFPAPDAHPGPMRECAGEVSRSVFHTALGGGGAATAANVAKLRAYLEATLSDAALARSIESVFDAFDCDRDGALRGVELAAAAAAMQGGAPLCLLGNQREFDRLVATGAQRMGGGAPVEVGVTRAAFTALGGRDGALTVDVVTSMRAYQRASAHLIRCVMHIDEFTQ